MAAQTPSSSSWETREEALCGGPTWARRCDQGHEEGSRVGSQGPEGRGGSSCWARPATEDSGQALQTGAENEASSEEEQHSARAGRAGSELETQPSEAGREGPAAPCTRAQHRTPALRSVDSAEKTVTDMGPCLVQNEYLQLPFFRDR